MGSDPLAYLTVIARPRSLDDAYLEGLARGLADEQRTLRPSSGRRRHGLDRGPAPPVADHPRHRAGGPGATPPGRPAGRPAVRLRHPRRRRHGSQGAARPRHLRGRGAAPDRPLPDAPAPPGPRQRATWDRQRRDRRFRRPAGRPRPHTGGVGGGGRAAGRPACRDRPPPPACPGRGTRPSPAATTTSCSSRCRRSAPA